MRGMTEGSSLFLYFRRLSSRVRIHVVLVRESLPERLLLLRSQTMRTALLFCLLTVAVLAAQAPSHLTGADPEEKPGPDVLGRRIESFTLQDFRCKSHSLDDYVDQPVIVLCFLGTECPL